MDLHTSSPVQNNSNPSEPLAPEDGTSSTVLRRKSHEGRIIRTSIPMNLVDRWLLAGSGDEATREGQPCHVEGQVGTPSLR